MTKKNKNAIKKITDLFIPHFLSIFLLILTIYISKNNKSMINSRAAYPIPTTVKIAFMGDLNIGRTINYVAQKNNDFNLFDTNMTSFLKSKDLNVANLESTIIGKDLKTGYNPCPIESERKLMIFCGDPEFVPYFKLNKFVFTLANNHINDFNINKLNGKELTMNTLNTNGVPFYYSHDNKTEFIQKNINNIRIGFLGIDLINHFGGFNAGTKQKIVELIKKYDNKVDWLVLSIHWGKEYDTKQSKDQIDFAHTFIDAGADIIHGHHPHVLQPYEIYKNKVIIYSLGNFVFDQNFSIETNTSAIYSLILSKDKLLSIKKNIINITDDGKPHLNYLNQKDNNPIRGR